MCSHFHLIKEVLPTVIWLYFLYIFVLHGDLQESVLRKNPDVVIATPGRLIDHLKNTPSFTLDSIEVLVLDEADRCVLVILFFHFCTSIGQCFCV
jgi:superfamily II DNA/RNA helicase